MKKILIYSALILLFASFLFSNYGVISVEKLKKAIDNNEDFILIDVRTKGEYTGNLGHIKGSILIPLHTLNANLDKISKYKNKVIYVVCRSGNRSGAASRMLTEEGFKKVFNVMGGMIAWNSKGYPVER